VADILKLNADTSVTSLTQKRILFFWLPLASSWLLMMCEIPFISAALARLPEAQTMIAAFGITTSISITVESPVIMLLATATALAATQQAYLTIRRFTLHLMALCTLLQVLVAFTPLYGLVVSSWMGIPPAIAAAAQPGLQIMTFWTAAIGWRRFKQGVMIRFGQTRLIGIGTIVRLTFSAGSATVLALSERFSGVAVGSLALMAGVVAEMLYTQFASNATIAKLPIASSASESSARQFSNLSYASLLKYHAPLAAVSLLTLLGQPLIGAALARATHPEASLAAWPVVFSLIGIFRSLPMALPEAVIALQRGHDTQTALRRFCINVGLVTSGALLILAVTPLGHFYLTNLIGLKTDLAELALPGVLLGIAIPFIMAIQSFWRGLLMGRKSTTAVYIAMMINLLTLALALIGGVMFRAPGVQLAIVALTLSLITEGAFLAWQVNRTATA
jgi:hypothetical protein